MELELVLWYVKMFTANMGKISKLSKVPGYGIADAVAETMQGIGVRKEHALRSLNEAVLEDKEFDKWTEKDIQNYCWALREVSKPTLIIANKMDLPFAAENFAEAQREVQGADSRTDQWGGRAHPEAS